MLEPEFYTKWNDPIFLKIENGSFICKNIATDNILLFDCVTGRLNNIYAAYRQFKNGSYNYWHLELKDNDNDNTYIICFPYTSAMFQSVLLKLATAKSLKNIKIEPYKDNNKITLRRKHSKVRVYADNIELKTLKIKLPKIDCCNWGMGRIRKDYTNRINAIIPIIDTILNKNENISTRMRK